MRRHVSAVCLAALFVAVNLLLHRALGVQSGGDTSRYTEGAQRLLAGLPLLDKQPSYAGYIAVVALVGRWGLGAIVLAQCLISGTAVWAVYRLGLGLAGSLAGLVACSLFVADADLQYWNHFILTDSLYVSFAILSTALFVSAQKSGRPAAWVIFAPVLAFTVLLRPNGWILLPAFASVLGLGRTSGRRALRCLVLLGILAAFLGAAAALKPLSRGIEREAPGEMLQDGQVIWGYDGWRVSMPAAAKGASHRWQDSIGYVAQHPLACARLAGARIGVELLHARPFFTAAHNAGVIGFLLPVYTLALLGGWRRRREPGAAALIAVIVGHLAVIGLTFADWNGRFLQYFLPAVFVLTGAGAVEVISWARVAIPPAFARRAEAQRANEASRRVVTMRVL